MNEAEEYFWDAPYLFKCCGDQIIRRCIAEPEQLSILEACYSSEYGGHYSGRMTTFKVLQSGFFWPTLFKDAYLYSKKCERSRRTGGMTWKQEMPQ